MLASLTKIDVKPITTACGAVVEGINLREPLDKGTIDALRQAWFDRGVLFFRDQHLTEEQLETFIGYFGTPITEPSNASFGADPEAPPIHSIESAPVKHVAERWHSDATWLAEPPAATALQLVKVPPVGGDTLFANVAVAYDDLIEPLQNLLDGLEAVHWMLPSLDAMNTTAHDEKIIYTHPVIRVHPESGRKVIFVSEGWTRNIVGIPPAQSVHILALLYDHIRSPFYSMRWRWTPGDVALWDNRTVQHFAVPDYDSGRAYNRCVIAGDRPYGPKGK